MLKFKSPRLPSTPTSSCQYTWYFTSRCELIKGSRKFGLWSIAAYSRQLELWTFRSSQTALEPVFVVHQKSIQWLSSVLANVVERCPNGRSGFDGLALAYDGWFSDGIDGRVVYIKVVFFPVWTITYGYIRPVAWQRSSWGIFASNTPTCAS